MSKQKTSETITSYKGFDKDLACHPEGGERVQYAIGETVEMDGEVEPCKRGFHACEYPLDVFRYYAPAGSRFAVVEQSGALARHDGDSKVASSRLTVKAEITLAGIIKAAIEYTFQRAKPVDPESPASATGYQGAASATGTRGAASATGDQGAASATGDHGAASATGDQGAASATGYDGRVMGREGNALFLVERDDDYNIISVWAGIAGRDGIKPDTWYVLRDGKAVEVQP